MCEELIVIVELSCGVIDRLDIFFFQAEDGIRDLVRSRGLRRCV